MTASVSVIPTLVSTTMTITSAVSMAVSACRAIAPWMPFTFGSHPPVSCTQNRCPPQSAIYEIRSRVTPGKSSTTASRRPKNRLTRVDLPTLGRPTMATVHRFSSRCGVSRSNPNSFSNCSQSDSEKSSPKCGSRNSDSSGMPMAFSSLLIYEVPPSADSSTREISVSMASGSDRSEVSRMMASSAGWSGSTARMESAVSRWMTSASTTS